MRRRRYGSCAPYTGGRPSSGDEGRRRGRVEGRDVRTPVAIVGAGPVGSLLSLLLGRHGIDAVVNERFAREYVLGRIRAGVLEWTMVEVLRRAGLADRMDEEGAVHDSVELASRGERIDSIGSPAST